jgi:hypothetical protein
MIFLFVLIEGSSVARMEETNTFSLAAYTKGFLNLCLLHTPLAFNCSLDRLRNWMINRQARRAEPGMAATQEGKINNRAAAPTARRLKRFRDSIK